MAFLEFNYYSRALKKHVGVNILLPEAGRKQDSAGLGDVKKYKTLYLLHGLSGNRSSWMRQTSIERYADKYDIAVVMPEVDRSWYTDTAYGASYFTFVAEELPRVCRGYFSGMSPEREDNFAAGLSMGGYGALKLALTYPERFAGCASLSGSLDITRKNREVNLPEWKALFDFNMESPLELEGSSQDLYALADKKHKEGAKFPKIYMWCGTEDNPHLLKSNRDLHTVFTKLGIEHCYKESQGDHSWPWWDKYIQDAMAFLFE